MGGATVYPDCLHQAPVTPAAAANASQACACGGAQASSGEPHLHHCGQDGVDLLQGQDEGQSELKVQLAREESGSGGMGSSNSFPQLEAPLAMPQQAPPLRRWHALNASCSLPTMSHQQLCSPPAPHLLAEVVLVQVAQLLAAVAQRLQGRLPQLLGRGGCAGWGAPAKAWVCSAGMGTWQRISGLTWTAADRSDVSATSMHHITSSRPAAVNRHTP